MQWFWNLVSVWAEIDENCNGDGSLLHATTPEWRPNCNANSEEKWPRRCRGCKGQKSSRIFSHIYADDPRNQMISCAGDDVLTNRNTQQGLMTWGVPKANSIIIPAQTWIERLSHLIVADFRSLCWWNILHSDQKDGVHDPSNRIYFYCFNKGRVRVLKRRNFRKSSKWPNPQFRKLVMQFFSENVRKETHKRSKIFNINFWIDNQGFDLGCYIWSVFEVLLT